MVIRVSVCIQSPAKRLIMLDLFLALGIVQGQRARSDIAEATFSK